MPVQLGLDCSRKSIVSNAILIYHHEPTCLLTALYTPVLASSRVSWILPTLSAFPGFLNFILGISKSIYAIYG